MIELGVKQKLYIDHKTDFGVYLSDTPERNGKSDCVLLPKKQVPQNAKIGDEVEVFVYRDSKDREIATTNMPKLAVLQVAQVNNIGGFMYWGLEKDLLLPYSEQVVKVQKGEKYLVGLYIDKSDRLCATMKVYDFLRTDSPYKTDDIVEGTLRVVDHIPEPAVDNRRHTVYNIGCSDPVKLMDFILILEEAIGKKADKIMLPMQQGDVSQTYADTSKLEIAVGYKPRTSLKTGIEQFVKWYNNYYK